MLGSAVGNLIKPRLVRKGQAIGAGDTNVTVTAVLALMKRVAALEGMLGVLAAENVLLGVVHAVERSAGGPATYGNTLYTIRFFGGSEEGLETGVEPINRILAEPSMQITPAPVGSLCLLHRRTDAAGTLTVEVVVYGERLLKNECGDQPSPPPLPPSEEETP